jgi:hypothetical protein
MSRDDTPIKGSAAQPADHRGPDGASVSAKPGASGGQRFIVGVNGDIITLADLPSPSITRWVIRRKAEIVLAVRGGLLSLDEACKRYRLTAEEFAAWESAIEHHGILGLRQTHVQDHRHADKR